VSQVPPQSVSVLLSQWRSGNQGALQELIPLVYRELRAVAHRCLRSEREGHTLQTTALVHETYLRLADQHPFDADTRAHFVGIAAHLMRQILVDYARGHRAAKRGADCRIPLDSGVVLPFVRATDLLALDDALAELAKLDEQQNRIVELRFFGGLTVEEAADVLGISRSTVKREWNVAKAWLTRQMKRGSRASGGVAKN
jgi:RNA polymerase sigma factor (TIGR02999 family)